MAKGVLWSERAKEDLQEIVEYISQDSRRYAARVLRKILASTRNLARFPHLGRVVPELRDTSVRELIVYNYRIIYRIHQVHVMVGAVVHGARRLPNALRGREI